MIRKTENYFILETKNTQYILEIDEENKLVQNYYGAKINDYIPNRSHVCSFFVWKKMKRVMKVKISNIRLSGIPIFVRPHFPANFPTGVA